MCRNQVNIHWKNNIQGVISFFNKLLHKDW
jgi:hypothetical protein